MTICRDMFGPRGCERTSLREPSNPECPWHGLAPCRACGEPVWGNSHYVPAVGHLTPHEDAQEPFYECGVRT